MNSDDDAIHARENVKVGVCNVMQANSHKHYAEEVKDRPSKADLCIVDKRVQ